MSRTHIIENVMTRDPAIVAPNDPVRVAVERMCARGCRRLPVVENGKLVGIISDRDLRRATNSPLVLHERWHDEFLLNTIPVRACMSVNPVTVTPRTLIADAARLMRDRKFGGLPAVDDDTLVGIVTETDLLSYLIKILEVGS